MKRKLASFQGALEFTKHEIIHSHMPMGEIAGAGAPIVSFTLSFSSIPSL